MTSCSSSTGCVDSSSDRPRWPNGHMVESLSLSESKLSNRPAQRLGFTHLREHAGQDLSGLGMSSCNPNSTLSHCDPVTRNPLWMQTLHAMALEARSAVGICLKLSLQSLRLEREREREIQPYVHSANVAYEDKSLLESVYMSLCRDMELLEQEQ